MDPSYLARIELGVARPSMETCARLGLALGADLAARLYPNTGPLVRDRHQAAIAESLLTIVHPSWTTFAEMRVSRPARGWIDLGLFSRSRNVLVAVEIQSQLRRLEQMVRWSEEKARSLPSWDGWLPLGNEPAISRLLVVRATRATRAVAHEFGRVLRTAFAAHPLDAMASLQMGDAWPGPAVLWAEELRGASRGYRIVAGR